MFVILRLCPNDGDGMCERKSVRELVEAAGRGDSFAVVELRKRYSPILSHIVETEIPAEFRNVDEVPSPGAEVLVKVECNVCKTATNVRPSDGQSFEDAFREQLVKLVRQEVFLWLTRRYESMIKARIRRAMSDKMQRQDAGEQIWNDTLWVGWKRLDRFEWRGPNAFVSWLMEIAEGQIRDLAKYWTREKRNDGLKVGEPAHGDSSGRGPVDREYIDNNRPSTPVRQRELAERLDDVMRQILTRDEHAAVRWSYCEFMTVEQVARRMEKTTGSVKMLLFRARKKLRTALADSSLFQPSR